jgi:hypothetical protein
MTDQEQKELIGSVIDSLAALTANQATIIELLYDNLPDLSETEQLTVTQCANKNYEIAEGLQAALKQVWEV